MQASKHGTPQSAHHSSGESQLVMVVVSGQPSRADIARSSPPSVHALVCAWRPGATSAVDSWVPFTLFLRTVSSLAWSWPSTLGWLAREP